MTISTVEEVRNYVQKDYWISGQTDGKSGYENFFINWEWNNRLLDHLEKIYDFKGKKILDLGCAYGQVVAAMLKRKYDAYGTDLSDYAIEAGQVEYPPLKGRTIQGSCHQLRYSDNEFNFLYSNQVFEHIPASVCDELAKSTYRVTKPGGLLWCGLVLDLNSDFQPQGYNPEDIDKTHINLRPKAWWDEKFIAAGWKVEDNFDKAFRNVKINGYSHFEEYGWHSICYKK